MFAISPNLCLFIFNQHYSWDYSSYNYSNHVSHTPKLSTMLTTFHTTTKHSLSRFSTEIPPSLLSLHPHKIKERKAEIKTLHPPNRHHNAPSPTIILTTKLRLPLPNKHTSTKNLNVKSPNFSIITFTNQITKQKTSTHPKTKSTMDTRPQYPQTRYHIYITRRRSFQCIYLLLSFTSQTIQTSHSHPKSHHLSISTTRKPSPHLLNTLPLKFR